MAPDWRRWRLALPRSGGKSAVSCWPAGLHADLLYAKPGDALRASAGPARTQARPAARAGGPQAGQPGGVRQQLGYAPRARHGDDRPDPAAGQRQPLPRPICCGTARHRTHNPIFSFMAWASGTGGGGRSAIARWPFPPARGGPRRAERRGQEHAAEHGRRAGHADHGPWITAARGSRCPSSSAAHPAEPPDDRVAVYKELPGWTGAYRSHPLKAPPRSIPPARLRPSWGVTRV